MENRKSFFERLSFLPFNDFLDVKLAYDLGKYWFRAKFRKELDEKGCRIRYFEHLRRVALIQLDELKLADPKMLIAGLMHDAYEDTCEEDYAIQQIERRFGDEVALMVRLLSKVPKEGYLDKLMDFADWRILMIKACDRLDNLRSLKAGSVEFQRKQINETREKYYVVFDKLVAITPIVHNSKAIYLRDTIKEITEKFVIGE